MSITAFIGIADHNNTGVETAYYSPELRKAGDVPYQQLGPQYEDNVRFPMLDYTTGYDYRITRVAPDGTPSLPLTGSFTTPNSQVPNNQA